MRVDNGESSGKNELLEGVVYGSKRKRSELKIFFEVECGSLSLF